MTQTATAIDQAYGQILERLRAARSPQGWWEGRLSPSALGTATAISALVLAGGEADETLIAGGVNWLADDQNVDGGWGDTPESPSNLSTTLLCLAALRLAAGDGREAAAAGSGEHRSSGNSEASSSGGGQSTMALAEGYVTERAGLTAEERVEAVCRLYGSDRTFAVPILMNLALAGLVPWHLIPRLPFELAVLPHAVLRFFRAQVVSYALPALIAIGQLLHVRRPTRFMPLRWLRTWLRGATLRRLGRLQPTTGGFIEAVPLTAFVVMSLAAADRNDDAVVAAGLEFLRRTARPTGCWPIDSNLSVWLTSQAATALWLDRTEGQTDAGRVEELAATWAWLADRQQKGVHPFTSSPAGGWGWTHLAGGVPDADDTSAALLALRDALPAAADNPGRLISAATPGVQWLLGLQNSDGGWPTFCRGWGRLPFDRSGCDLTAHALRAIHAWRDHLPEASLRLRAGAAIGRGLKFLARHQRADGSWLPLWFGNQQAADGLNPTIGTSRVLAAYRDLDLRLEMPARRGVAWLLEAQDESGGWGGARGLQPTVEETSLALEALCGYQNQQIAAARDGAAQWLFEKVKLGQIDNAAPIGLYFTSLWYCEELYPIIWSALAFGRYLQCRSGFKAAE